MSTWQLDRALKVQLITTSSAGQKDFAGYRAMHHTSWHSVFVRRTERVMDGMILHGLTSTPDSIDLIDDSVIMDAWFDYFRRFVFYRTFALYLANHKYVKQIYAEE